MTGFQGSRKGVFQVRRSPVFFIVLYMPMNFLNLKRQVLQHLTVTHINKVVVNISLSINFRLSVGRHQQNWPRKRSLC